MICFEIEEIEKNKKKFISSHWKKNKKKDEGDGVPVRRFGRDFVVGGSRRFGFGIF